MLFNKTDSQTSSPVSISFLGNSPLSLYLAHILQSYGHNITIICPPTEAEEFNATDIIFKNPLKLQTQRYNFKFDHELRNIPQLLIIASDISTLRRDLLLIKPSKLEGTDIINFTPSCPSNFVNDTLKVSAISAYYFGWLHQHQNTIISLSKSPQIIINTPTDNSKLKERLQSYFPTSPLELKFSPNQAETHWNWLATNTLVCLHEMNSEKTISSQIKNSFTKNNFDTCLKEISLITSDLEISIDKNNILSSIYNLNEFIFFSSYCSKDRQRLLLNRFCSLLFPNASPDSERYPYLHETIKEIYNKL